MEINTNIILPDAEENRLSIFADLKQMESQNDQNIRKDHLTPISFPNPNSEKLIQDLNRDLMDRTVYLHSTVSILQKDSNIKESLAESIRDSAYEKNVRKVGCNFCGSDKKSDYDQNHAGTDTASRRLSQHCQRENGNP